jgi:hypothetical protein
MCSAADDPTNHDDMVERAYGVKYAPRAYNLSGERPVEPEPRPSIALAIIGDQLEYAERAVVAAIAAKDEDALAAARIMVTILFDLRGRVARAEHDAR